VAAFCACCGSEITLKAEACPVCGTPQHGMLQRDRSSGDDGVAVSQEDVKIDGTLRRPLSRESR
jgi:predicted amidophosphoribosyltransferase